MTPLIFASAMALFRATLSSPDPLFPTDGTAGGPTPVNGIWAGLPAGCAAPTSLDLSVWPRCATPVGFVDGVIAVLEKPRPGQAAAPDQYTSIARTKFWSVKPAAVAGSPASASEPAFASAAPPTIVQVDVPILFASSTIYIAVQPDAVDAHGGFVSATGWPISCPAAPVPGVSVDGGRCAATTAEGVRAAAAIRPDAAKTYRLVRITSPADQAAVPDAPPPSAAPQPVAAPQPSESQVPTPMTAPLAPAADAPGAPPSTPPTAAPGEVTAAPLPPPPPAGPSSPGS